MVLRVYHNQLRKQFSVYSVRLLPPEQSIRRELVLIKVRAESRSTDRV